MAAPARADAERGVPDEPVARERRHGPSAIETWNSATHRAKAWWRGFALQLLSTASCSRCVSMSASSAMHLAISSAQPGGFMPRFTRREMLAAAPVLGVAAALAIPSVARADQPHMEAALDHLRAARK